MRKSGHVLTSFVGFPTRIAAALAGVPGRALLVLGSLACGLLLLDALFSGLEWALTRGRRALAAARPAF